MTKDRSAAMHAALLMATKAGADLPFAKVKLSFAGGERLFSMPYQLATDWEARTGRSLIQTFRAMVETRDASLKDVRDFVFMGLIGGGMAAMEAADKVETFVERRPLAESQPVALGVLEAFLFGNEEYRAAKA